MPSKVSSKPERTQTTGQAGASLGRGKAQERPAAVQIAPWPIPAPAPEAALGEERAPSLRETRAE